MILALLVLKHKVATVNDLIVRGVRELLRMFTSKLRHGGDEQAERRDALLAIDNK